MNALTKPRVRLDLEYLAASIALLLVLICIALFARDSIVRPFLGDVLAVVWVYLCIRAVLNMHYFIASFAALAIAFTLELAQYFELIEHLGLQNITAAKVILGATFDPLDLLAYTIGFSLVCVLEFRRTRGPRTQTSE